VSTRVIYSFNKTGFEARYWDSEIAGASTSEYQFLPFNHGVYLNPNRYIRAQLLDNLYFERHPGLVKMYDDFVRLIRDTRADAVIVDNCQPYHPEFLRTLSILKVLRTSDGPLSAYDRDFAYLHAYDLVLYHSPAYSRDLTMAEKLAYCGAREAHFWPNALFDVMHDPRKSESELFSGTRDIQVLFVGALFPNKMPLLASVKRALGRRFRLHGIAGWKKNLYFNLKYGFPGWVSPIQFEEYVPLYQRTKIGINVHNRGKYTVGGYRLFELPANGVMQISDGGEYLGEFFKIGVEIEGYETTEELIDKVKFYLAHDSSRERIARAGYVRVTSDHRIKTRLHSAADTISRALSRDGIEVDSARAKGTGTA
jgi:spore maturation protein CgeB